MKLYQQQDSGNCYKVRLVLAHLGRDFQIVDVNANDGSTRTGEYLAINPNGKVPLLAFDDGRALAESNAIALYLAHGSQFLPDDAWELAKVHEWLFFEQYSHEPAIAVRRSLTIYPERAAQATRERMEELLAAGNRALEVMSATLANRDWLAPAGPTVADFCLYAYTHMAADGGFDLTAFPPLERWLQRVSSLPGHVDVNWRPG